LIWGRERDRGARERETRGGVGEIEQGGKERVRERVVGRERERSGKEVKRERGGVSEKER
jgi:hypothetical protein